jgi:general secretion pathway protein G
LPRWPESHARHRDARVFPRACAAGTALAIPCIMHRAFRAARRGMTLIEVMVVVVIIGLIASATAVAVYHHLVEARIKVARIGARTIRSAATMYRLDHADECPSAEQLREGDLLDRGQSIDDPWGTRFGVVCEGNAVTVVSAGPDKRAQTEDDLREPPPT